MICCVEDAVKVVGWKLAPWVPGQYIDIVGARVNEPVVVTDLPCRLSPLDVGGQAPGLVRHDVSGAQVSTVPLADVKVTLSEEAGMPIAVLAI